MRWLIILLTVKEAKSIICGISKTKNVARRICDSNPNTTVADLRDIDGCFEKLERGEAEPPKFVAHGYASFPPSGFEYMAPTMCALRDEIAAMRHEVMELKENAGRDIRALNDINTVVQDVCEIKALLRRNTPAAPPNTESEPPNRQENIEANSEDNGASSDVNEREARNIDDGFQIVENRPYANALRSNGLPANPAR